MGPVGFEPPAHSSGNTHDGPLTGAESGAVGAESGAWPLPDDDRLSMVVTRWAELPEAVRQTVYAAVCGALPAAPDPTPS